MLKLDPRGKFLAIWGRSMDELLAWKPPGQTVALVGATGAGKKPNLDRPRKTVADVHGIPSSLDMGRSASAAAGGKGRAFIEAQP